MSYQVVVAPEAKFLLAEASEWWGEHRPAARSRVVHEYFRLVNFLADSPNSGTFSHQYQ